MRKLDQGITMRIGTAEHDSTFTTQGMALREVFLNAGIGGPIDIVEARFASTENARKLEEGGIDFGFMASNWIGRALRGEAPFSEPLDLRMVAPMNAGPMYFITRADSSIETMSDLRGKRVSVGPEHSGTRQHAHSILGALGIGFEDFTPLFMDFAEGAQALAHGEIDAQLQCPYPNKVMNALDAETDLRVIGLSEAELAVVMAASPVYQRTVMRKGSLRALNADALQPAVLNVLVTHARADEEMVAQATRAIVDHARDLELLNPLFAGLPELFEPLRSWGAAAFTFEGVDLHPGAIRAYQEAGLLT
ncbi:MAG: C4-dicarboxylate transporter substrate-binding protein [Hyphomicrobiales bacterium]|jgi:TRAP transporter TAXI family solute receptor|nr:C4-dicarboxylate transporter substrate-binding protein [Hyphomicrobiales bacterium]